MNASDTLTFTIAMAYFKTVVTPLLMHWSHPPPSDKPSLYGSGIDSVFMVSLKDIFIRETTLHQIHCLASRAKKSDVG